MKKIKYPTFFLALLFAFQSFAFDTALSIGNLCEFVGVVATDELGTKSYCQFNPYLMGHIQNKLDENWTVSAEMGITIPKSGRDQNINKFSFFPLVNLDYTWGDFKLGPGIGLYVTRISSGGGEEVLNNGTSVDSFPLPDETVYTRNTVLNLHLGYQLNTDWSLNSQVLFFNLLTNEDRAFHIGAYLTYFFGEWK